jgi:hypothetical protein
MYMVAAVGAYIADHWDKPNELDRARIVKGLLLHDTGNIIKFDFSRPDLLGDAERKDLEKWKRIQTEFTQQYRNEDVATHALARLSGVDEKAFEILDAVGSAKLQKALETADWNKKIACYSDFRIGPFGVLTVNERFDDIVARYRGRGHAMSDIEETERKRQRCLQLEKELQAHLTFNLQTLDASQIEKGSKELVNSELS